MRTTSFIVIVVAIAAICLAVSFRAEAFQSEPLVEFLAKDVGRGQSAAFKSGCNGYLHKRITQHKSPDVCLSEGNSECERWYSTDPVKKAQCMQGCQYLNSKE